MSKRLRCKDCENSEKYSYEEPCSTCYSYENFEEKKKQLSNADKIRSMSDSELAELLPIVSNFLCRPTDDCMKMICNRGECEKTKDCALNWLKSPTTD